MEKDERLWWTWLDCYRMAAVEYHYCTSSHGAILWMMSLRCPTIFSSLKSEGNVSVHSVSSCRILGPNLRTFACCWRSGRGLVWSTFVTPSAKEHAIIKSAIWQKISCCLHAEHKYVWVLLLWLCFCSLARVCWYRSSAFCVRCSADRIEWALIQLLLFDAQLTHPGKQLRRRDEETSAQQEGKHIGFLSKDRGRHSLRHCHYINKKHCGFL